MRRCDGKGHLYTSLWSLDGRAGPDHQIQVHASTQELLDALKPSGQTYEGLILEMVEEHFPPHLVRELERRLVDLQGPSAGEVLRRAGV